jgi:hypothetical protein
MENFYDFVDEVEEEEVPNIRQQRILYIGYWPTIFSIAGPCVRDTLWLSIVLGGNPFPSTIFSFHRNCICFFISLLPFPYSV